MGLRIKKEKTFCEDCQLAINSPAKKCKECYTSSMELTRVCIKCKEEKGLLFFNTVKRKTGNFYNGSCADCEKLRNKAYEKSEKRKIYKKLNYNREEQDIRELRFRFKKTNIKANKEIIELYLNVDACDICGITENVAKKRLAIDHDHSTGNFRGFLCHHCNIGLGAFQDNNLLMIKAINYLNTKTSRFELLKRLEST